MSIKQTLITNGCRYFDSGPFYSHGSTLILAWISNYIHYEVWDEITNPLLNFNGCTVAKQWIWLPIHVIILCKLCC